MQTDSVFKGENESLTRIGGRIKSISGIPNWGSRVPDTQLQLDSGSQFLSKLPWFTTDSRTG